MLPGSPASSSLFTRSTSSFILKPPGPRPTLVCLPIVTFVARLMLFPAIDLSIQLVHTWARLIATEGAVIGVYQFVIPLVHNDERSRAHAANQLLCLLMLQNVARHLWMCHKPILLHFCLLHQPLRKLARPVL